MSGHAHTSTRTGNTIKIWFDDGRKGIRAAQEVALGHMKVGERIDSLRKISGHWVAVVIEPQVLTLWDISTMVHLDAYPRDTTFLVIPAGPDVKR